MTASNLIESFVNVSTNDLFVIDFFIIMLQLHGQPGNVIRMAPKPQHNNIFSSCIIFLDDPNHSLQLE